MDEIKRQFREYYQPGRSSKILFSVLCAFAFLLFAAWLFLRMDPFRGEALPFDSVNREQEGKYVSLEVIGIDDWSAARGDEYYYVVQASDNLLYLVRMTPEKFNTMQEQHAYWLSTGSDEASDAPIEPVPLEITGYSTAFPDQILETVAETYGDSTEDMSYYLGQYYLDTNMEERNSQLLFLPVLGGVLAVIALALFLSGRSNKKTLEKALAALEQNGHLLSAWNEFQLQHLEDPKNDTVLTDNYIFAKSSGDIIAYHDIVWAYKHIIRRNFMEINSFIVCFMRDKSKRQIMPLRNRKNAVDRILTVIAEKNPDALLGYTAENKKRYKEIK